MYVCNYFYIKWLVSIRESLVGEIDEDVQLNDSDDFDVWFVPNNVWNDSTYDSVQMKTRMVIL